MAENDRPPETGTGAPPGRARGYFHLLFTYFFRLFALNLLMLLCFLPAVTVPAAVTGASRAICSLIRGNPSYFWEEFWAEFRDRFLGKLGVFALLTLLPVSLSLWARLLGGDAGLAEAVFLSAGALSALLQCYFFTLVSVVELPLRVCLKNAALLLVLEWRDTLLLFLTLAALVFLGYNLYPYTLAPLAVILVSGTALFVCGRCMGVFERRRLLLDKKNENKTGEAQS